MKQDPVRRHFPRNLRNKPCLCGATKNNSEGKMVPVKAKHCCLPKVNVAYHSNLEKYVPNTGRRNYGN